VVAGGTAAMEPNVKAVFVLAPVVTADGAAAAATAVVGGGAAAAEAPN